MKALNQHRKKRQKTAEEIYNNAKSNFNNLMENSINLSAFDTNERTISCPASATLKYTYAWENIYNPGRNNESSEFIRNDYIFSFTSGEIIRNEDVTWEDILENEEKYEELKDHYFLYEQEKPKYQSSLNDFYRIRATGKYIKTEYDGWGGIEEDGSQGEDADVSEGTCFYDSYGTDNYRFSLNGYKFTYKFIENCYLRLSTLKDTDFYDELKYIKNVIDYNYTDHRRSGA